MGYLQTTVRSRGCRQGRSEKFGGPGQKSIWGPFPYGHTPITLLLYGIYVPKNLKKNLQVNLILTSYKDALRAHLNANDSITSS